MLAASGLTTLEDLNISGTAVGGTLLVGANLTPAPNDVIFGNGTSVLEIILNAQTGAGDGLTSDGITTDAIEIIFRGLLVDANALTGTIVIAQSQAGIFGPAGPAPEPGAWALMLTGFAGMGAALRMRRRRQAATA